MTPKSRNPSRIVLASRNRGKVRELSSVLDGLPVEVVGLNEIDPDARIAEPAETGDTFAANARDKAIYYARRTGEWALADDSGLVADALGGAPGVRSARYASETLPPGASREQIDGANNRKLLEALEGVPADRRTARFICRLALATDGRVVLEAEGILEGTIGTAPRGHNGFGYDPIFHLPGGGTVAELSSAAKNAISHRGRAAREFARRLKDLLSGGA